VSKIVSQVEPSTNWYVGLYCTVVPLLDGLPGLHGQGCVNAGRVLSGLASFSVLFFQQLGIQPGLHSTGVWLYDESYVMNRLRTVLPMNLS
jgi:hypothetical protein